MVTKWVFDDPLDLSTFTFEINPTDGPALPAERKHINYSNSLGPDGSVLIYAGRDEVREMTWTGTILTQSMYDAMVLWTEKRYPINLTDDFGITRLIYIEEFSPKRVYKSSAPLYTTYTMTVMLVE